MVGSTTRSLIMSQNENNPDSSDYQKFLETTLAGNLTALRVHSTADTKHSDITEYVSMLENSGVSFKYVCSCLYLTRVVSNFLKHPTTVLTAMLFHKIAYEPGDKNSLRASCETVMKFYSPDKVSVLLISYMKAAQTEKTLSKRFGDDRDYIADITYHVYGLPWEEFRQAWSYLLQEFVKVGRDPTKYKRYTRLRLNKILEQAKNSKIYRTKFFHDMYEEQAISNVERMLNTL